MILWLYFCYASTVYAVIMCFLMLKISAKFKWGHPQKRCRYRRGKLKLLTFVK